MKRFAIVIYLLLLGCGTLPQGSAPDRPASDQAQIDPVKHPPARALDVAEAIEVVLGRSDAIKYAEAVSLLKKSICTSEIKGARSSRRDQSLLQDRYPKGVTLNVDGGTAYWTAYDRIHFAARHLMEYFDSSDIKEHNSWWPAGTTREQVDAYLRSVIEQHGSQIRLPSAGSSGAGFKYQDFKLSGMKVRIGIESTGRVTSFFPVSGQGVISLSEDELEEVLEAIGKE